MKRILIVKVTSLGDVVQTLPAVADLHRAFPGVSVDWAVDESCAEVVRWHPGVSKVLCAPLRRFKKLRNGGDLKAISASIGALRVHRYDAVIDLHGVYKSAIISFLARAASATRPRISAKRAPVLRTRIASARGRTATRGTGCA